MIRTILLLLILSSLEVYSQGAGFRLISKDYEGITGSPWLYTQGDTIIVEADTVYVINANRYNFYKRIHQDILNSDDSTCNDLLNSYEKRLEDYEMRYQDLAQVNNETQVVTLGLLEQSQEKLQAIKMDLEENQEELGKAQEEIELLKKDVRKAKNQNFKKTLAIGAAGLAIGLIFGILIAL